MTGDGDTRPEEASGAAMERARAERIVMNRRRQLVDTPADQIPALLHELEVRQVELEMQNEELQAMRGELEASRDRYADLYDFAPVGYLMLDGGGCILSSNLVGARLLGLERQRLIGHPFIGFVVPEKKRLVIELLTRGHLAPLGEELHAELILRQRKSGATVQVALHAVAVTGPPDRGRQLRVVLVDRTELRRAEAARDESEALLALTVAAAGAGSGAIDLETGAVSGDANLLSMLSLPPGGLVHVEEILARVHPEDVALLRAEVGRIRRAPEGSEVRREFRLHLADGTVRWSSARARVVTREGRRRLLGLLFDVTDQKETEAALRDLSLTLERRVAERSRVAEERAERMRQLASALSHAEEGERQRISEVIHDSLQQSLVAARMRLVHLSGAGRVPSAADITLAIALIDDTLAAARKLTVELDPPQFSSTVSLAEALGWLGDKFAATHDLDVRVSAPSDLPPIPAHLRPLVLQASRELLFNVVKHAGVTEATIDLSVRHEVLRIAVSDRGPGFDDAIGLDRELCSGTGQGLPAVHERVRAAGGKLAVEPKAGGGSRVVLELPLAALETSAGG